MRAVSAIKLAAERKAGELLAVMPKQAGSRGVGKKVESQDAIPLSEMGITATQSSRWQQAAKVPEEKFREYVESADVLGKELTSAGLRKLANAVAPKNGAKKPEPVEGI